MIIQEPVQASIWQCLNNYNYSDAVFLSERLYAEVRNEDNLFVLCTAYYRSGRKDQAYYFLKTKFKCSPQCRYLFSTCAYDLKKYSEAEAALLEGTDNSTVNLDDMVFEFGEQAAYALLLLGKIANKTERRARAIDAWKRALKLNPFLWSCFEHLCEVGDNPCPQTVFQTSNLEHFPISYGNVGSIESVIIPNGTNDSLETTPKELIGYVVTPQQILLNVKKNNANPKIVNFTPEESPLAVPLEVSPNDFMPASIFRPIKIRMDATSESTPQPSFGNFLKTCYECVETTNGNAVQTLTESNSYNQSVPKRMKAQVVENFINRKEILQNSKPPVYNHCVPVTKTPTIQTNQNVRRSSRLFTSSYSVKENSKSPNYNKFTTPNSPKKTKQRTAKCNFTKHDSFIDLNMRNKFDKEKTETVTSIESKSDKNAVTNSESYLQKAVCIQKQSAEGLMVLLRSLGQAYLDLCNFKCKSVVEILNALAPHQRDTAWVNSCLGLAYFEMAEYDSSVKYFGEVRSKNPFQLKYMDVYSTALWHLQKEITLSVLAQDLTGVDKYSPVTWCVNGNCFSLHKEHDTAIRFFQRAVQVDPNFPYAYTLLGHEYITTEELDKAMSCFRSAIRLNPRHYNAWFGIGTIYSKQERYRLAEINYMRALSINPKSSVILCHIGVVQHAMKNVDKALSTLNMAIANSPKHPLCKFHRGSIYFNLGRHADALKELEELKEIVPKESLVYYLIGKVHKKLGNTDLALMHFSWATDLDPKGASSQIKEAFDPASARSIADNPSPTSLTANAHLRADNNFGQEIDRNNFESIPEDSDYSF